MDLVPEGLDSVADLADGLGVWYSTPTYRTGLMRPTSFPICQMRFPATICCGKGAGLLVSGLLIGSNAKSCLAKCRKCKLDIGLKVCQNAKYDYVF
jgi:hypothetical protein